MRTRRQQSGLIRHLKKHIVRRPGDTDLFWIWVTDQTPGTVLPSSGLWLDLEIRADLDLEVLDTFLRAVWVECCHSLSHFVVPERQILCERDPEKPRTAADPWQGNASGELPMAGVTIAQIAEHTLTFGYEYDYGTPTILSLQIMTRYQGPALEKGIRILSRNLKPFVACARCGREAAYWDVLHDNTPLCAEHAKKVDASGLLPIVNSPRTGIGSYAGPQDQSLRFEKRPILFREN